METPPEYVKVAPWSDKQKLTEEKLALGFYLSGHLFNAYAPEARRFARGTMRLFGFERRLGRNQPNKQSPQLPDRKNNDNE